VLDKNQDRILTKSDKTTPEIFSNMQNNLLADFRFIKIKKAFFYLLK